MVLNSIFSVSGEVVRSLVRLFLVMVLMVTGEGRGEKEEKVGGGAQDFCLFLPNIRRHMTYSCFWPIESVIFHFFPSYGVRDCSPAGRS